ncbi:DoxX family protein [Stenotrophomonas maltophilia]|uniref:DoxX family protein n=1 Tax=Stenotrophomonas maltophilia TaxID=40324 RepID=UPI0013DD4C38|nr:DoxX family protein [Stenotrophomonas maltophilia]
MSTYSTTTFGASSSTRLQGAVELLGRLLQVALFLLSGFGKLSAYEATAGYMASVGVPTLMLPLVILAEIGGALAIIAGRQTRIVAVLLAGFTLATAFLFHNNVADQTQMIMFLKNVSIAGAFLMLAANGAGRFSLDARKAR